MMYNNLLPIIYTAMQVLDTTDGIYLWTSTHFILTLTVGSVQPTIAELTNLEILNQHILPNTQLLGPTCWTSPSTVFRSNANIPLSAARSGQALLGLKKTYRPSTQLLSPTQPQILV